MNLSTTSSLNASVGYDTALGQFAQSLPGEWRSTATSSGYWEWRHFRPGKVALPAQGWKLHLSVLPPYASAFVRHILPLLTKFDLAFKLPATFEKLVALHSNRAGLTQIGKVVTIYPASDAVLRDVVDVIAANWQPPKAMPIRTDLPVTSTVGLGIRYGSFEWSHTIVDSLGRFETAFADTGGRVVPDRRDRNGRQAEWAPKAPLNTNGVPGIRKISEPIIVSGEKFVPLRALAHNPRGHVVLAMRVDDQRLVVVRHAFVGAECDEHGNDAVSRLTNERRMLEQLCDCNFSPNVVAYDETQHILITQDIAGVPLADMSLPDSLSGLLRMLQALKGLHEHGIVHRDIKPTNVICTSERAWLVDYEVAARIGTTAPAAAGTVGYIPPEGRNAIIDPSYDIYGVGASIFYLLIGCCPGRMPRKGNVGRQIGLLKLTGQHTAADLVSSFTQMLPARRPSAQEALKAVQAGLPRLLSEAQSRPQQSVSENAAWIRRAAVEAGRASRSFRVEKGIGHTWRNTHHFARFECQGINLGASGVLLGLCSIDGALRAQYFREDIAGGAAWLASQRGYENAHGLFTGNAGVSVALALAGRRLARPDLLRAARARFELAAAIQGDDFDLFSGSAGVIWSSCMLASILGDSWPLDAVAPLVKRTLDDASEQDGVISWRAGREFDASGARYFGAAHGAAGIAMALASWGRQSGCNAARTLAGKTMETIFRAARTGDSSNILAMSTGRHHAPHHWCHGVAGYLWCLLQEFDDVVSLQDAKTWAADAVIKSKLPCENATMCHGTAGSLEIFRMLSGRAWAPDEALRRERESIAVVRLLHQHLAGETVWSSEDPTVVTPDLWVGFLGPAAALALGAGNVRHALLSPGWLGRCASS